MMANIVFDRLGSVLVFFIAEKWEVDKPDLSAVIAGYRVLA